MPSQYERNRTRPIVKSVRYAVSAKAKTYSEDKACEGEPRNQGYQSKTRVQPEMLKC